MYNEGLEWFGKGLEEKELRPMVEGLQFYIKVIGVDSGMLEALESV